MKPTLEEIRDAIFTLEKVAVKMKAYYKKTVEFSQERKLEELIQRLSDLECMIIEDYDKLEEK